MEAVIKLSGWADGLGFATHKMLEFPLQMAMYEIVGNCDFEFKIKVEGETDVRYEHKISVVAERVCSCGYDADRKQYVERTFQHYEFNFAVPAYTLANVYEYAKEAIKKIAKK